MLNDIDFRLVNTDTGAVLMSQMYYDQGNIGMYIPDWRPNLSRFVRCGHIITYTEIFGDNPWWKSEEEINEDAKIKEWETSNIQWNPRIRYTFDYSNDIIYSLRGPRQVGKTTLIKIQIREFLQKGILPWSIMYYAFDIDNTPKDLVKVIENYLDRSKRQRGNNRAYLFLDEVSSIKDWQKCLLSAYLNEILVLEREEEI